MRRAVKPGRLHPADRPGKDGQVTNGQHVLVVDGLSETEEVLRTVLEPQGLRVNRIRTHFSPQPDNSDRPNLVILHEEQSADSKDVWPDVPRVIIGSVSARLRPQGDHESRAEYLSQPFQYGDLIRAVEDLLAD